MSRTPRSANSLAIDKPITPPPTIMISAVLVALDVSCADIRVRLSVAIQTFMLSYSQNAGSGLMCCGLLLTADCLLFHASYHTDSWRRDWTRSRVRSRSHHRIIGSKD